MLEAALFPNFRFFDLYNILFFSFGSGSQFGSGTGTRMHEGSGSAKAKSCGSSGSVSGSTTLDGNTDSEELFTTITHLHVEPLPEAKFRFLGLRFQRSTTLDGTYIDSEEPFTTISHLHVEPLPEADGVEHVIAAGQLRLRHVLHHITFMCINQCCGSRSREPNRILVLIWIWIHRIRMFFGPPGSPASRSVSPATITFMGVVVKLCYKLLRTLLRIRDVYPESRSLIFIYPRTRIPCLGFPIQQ